MQTFHDACRAIVRNAGTPALNYAVGYARAGLDMSAPDEIRVQSLYILNNITHWRGDEAKAARNILKGAAK